ncbi:MAG: SDR family oxidoreductase [Actinobacteria bacterium]|nr:SDR family oxidoreductase [Actinomycetota bacterium]MBO0834541.1 SDR family oxidoreductase [Actinomycetota bacterium]
MDLQLTGRRAVVTGGGSGIGKATAALLAEEGAVVAIASRSADRLRTAADEIAAASGRKVHPVLVDTSDEASVRAMAAQSADALGGAAEILVNCAAIPAGQRPVGGFETVTSEMFWADVNVKVLGYLRCAQALAPAMIAAGWGRIINVSGLAARSTGSVVGSIRNVSVAAMTKNLADELGRHGINVTVVHPGLTRTEATPGVVAATASREGVEPDAVERRLAAGNAIGRMITADEVAAVIAFLASPRSVAINGDAVACGGGTPRVIHY